MTLINRSFLISWVSIDVQNLQNPNKKPLTFLLNQVCICIMLKCKKRIFCQWKEAIVLGQKHVSDEAKDTLLRNVPDEPKDRENWFAQYTLLGKAGNCADKDKQGKEQKESETITKGCRELTRLRSNLKMTKSGKEWQRIGRFKFLAVISYIFCFNILLAWCQKYEVKMKKLGLRWIMRGMRPVMLVMVLI